MSGGFDSQQSSRASRARAIVRELLHATDGALPDATVVAAHHPDLEPEMTAELRKLSLIQAAERESTAGDPPAPPREIEVGGYATIDTIHWGGQGIVYRALQLSTGRQVAIKVLRSGRLATFSERARFDLEATLLARLSHPNIVQVIDSGMTEEGQRFVVMEFVDGDI